MIPTRTTGSVSRLAVLGLSALFAFSMVGCEDDGFEEAGENIDDAAEDVGDAIDDAADDLDD